MQILITAGMTPTASVSAGAVATYVLFSTFVSGASIVPGDGVATNLNASVSGAASFASNPLPLNSSVAALHPDSTVTSSATLVRTLTTLLSAGASFSAAPTVRKFVSRTAPPLIPGSGVVVPGPTTSTFIVTLPKRFP